MPLTTFARDGFVGPLRLFTPAECQRIAAYLHRSEHPAPPDWKKGRAVNERFLYDLAIRPALLENVTAFLGEDVVLWGASAVTRWPGDAQAWHSDIESSSADGRFVSVWIGLENTSRESALQMIARSHLLGNTVQEARFERGLKRELATPESMLAIAREREPEATLVEPEMSDGEALFFDGRLWHGSDNRRRFGRRLALLLQYAAADCAVRIPDLSQLDWPFRLRAAPLPPVILVSGSDTRGINRVVPAPPPHSKGRPMNDTVIHTFALPVDNPAKDFQAFSAFHGPTRTFADMECHASVLKGGQSPHLPHAHVEEELLIPLDGEVELRIATSPHDPAPRIERIAPGSFVYYPAGQHHTVRNPGTAAIGYLMFKWNAALAQNASQTASETASPLPTGIHHFGDVAPPVDARPFWTHRIFQGPTSLLRKLHAHLTVLQPGAGYEPHVDAYDVAIVLLSGTIETLGQTIAPFSVIYYAAGEPHGLRNVGAEPARYLVFEFHAPGVDALPRRIPLHRTLPARVIGFGKRLARPVWRRLRRKSSLW